MLTTKLTKNPSLYLIALAELALLLSLPRISVSSGQGNAAYIEEVRALNADDLGLLNPAGLSFSPGAIIRVPRDQPTIQAGINAARDGYLVLVSPGTYTEQLVLSGKTITLASQFHTTGDRNLINQTIIDGGGNDVITVDSSVGPDTKIIGFTIRSGDDGISAYTKHHILNNRFTGHSDTIDYEDGGVCRNSVIDAGTAYFEWGGETVLDLPSNAYFGSAPDLGMYESSNLNQPPSVDAGLDQTVMLSDGAVLDGTVTDDGLPNPPGVVSTTWSKISGSGVMTFTDAYTVDTTADFSAAGTYVLRLTADDGGLSASDEVTITVNPELPANLLVYPYLGETTTTSVVLSWATDGVGASEVRYSLDQSYSNVVAATDSTYDGKYWHSATVTGLTADTTYYYKVYTGGEDVTPWSEIAFTTAPESTAPRFTFVALGDSRPGTASSPPTQGALDVAAEMDQHSFDLAVHTGDIVYSGGICSGSDSSWNQYIRVYFDLYQDSIGDIPFYPSVGNHEVQGGDCGYQAYTDVYDLPENAPSGHEEEYYSFDWGNAHFVALDTEQSYSAGSTQYNWLVNDLQASTQPWKFVFFHRPPYSSGNHGGTSEVQTHLVPLFEAYSVDVVFNGHDHIYERTCPILDGACTTLQDGGVVYYVTGGGGAGLYSAGSNWFTAYSASIHHFLKLEVNDCWLRVDAIDTDGSVFDSYEIDHCGGPPTNQAPSVEAGPDQTITLSDSALLDGTVSDDGLPDPPGVVTTTWSQVSGTGVVTFTNAYAVDTTASFSAADIYVLRLTADDGELSTSDEVTIFVASSNIYLPLVFKNH